MVCTVNGYIRETQQLLPDESAYFEIPKLVNVLIFAFMHNKAPPGAFSFEWTITDEATLQEMRSAPFKQQFKSSVFSAFGVRWYLQVHPNGHNEQGYVDLYLNLPSLPPKVRAIEIAQTLRCVETDSKHDRTVNFDKSMGAGWSGHVLTTSAMQACESLTYAVNMELIAVYDVDGDDVTGAYLRKHEQLNYIFASLRNTAVVNDAHRFAWNITDPSLLQTMKSAALGQKFRSPMFSACGFRWNLEAYPNGRDKEGNVDFYLQLLSLPPKLKSVNVSFLLQCLETHTKHASSHEYERAYGVGWRDQTLSTDEIKACDTLTFVAKLELIAVYDLKGNDITHLRQHGMRYGRRRKERERERDEEEEETNQEEEEQVDRGRRDEDARKKEGARLGLLALKMEVMKQRVAAIESKLSSEEKENEQGYVTEAQFTQLQQQVNRMQQTIQQLMLKDMDPEQQRFKAWLDTITGLAAYYHVFVARGVTTFAKLSALSMQDIQSLGIDDIQYQMMILNKVLELNRNQAKKKPEPSKST